MQTDHTGRDIKALKKALKDALSIGEGTWVDFKEEGYDLSTNSLKAQFIKDILALSNMVESPGRHCYIFVGVKRDSTGGSNHRFPGVPNHPDDANLQSLVRAWGKQPPVFNYVTLEYEGVSVGAYVLKGGVSIPYVAGRTVGDVLWDGVVYIRRGSMNAVATSDEIHAIVERRKRWHSSQPLEPVAPIPSDLGPAEKDVLLAALETKDGGIHVLTTHQTGSWVSAGRASYIDEQDPAVAAIYRDALDRLVSEGYVRCESPKGTYYTLTGNGWSLAREFARQPVRQLGGYLKDDNGLWIDKRVELLGLLSRRASLAEDSDHVDYATDELVRIMLETQPPWRLPAAKELVRTHLRSGESVSQLISALDRKEPDVRRLAVWVLSRSGLPEARNGIIAALADPDEQVQALAYWALEKKPPEKARSAMRAIRQKFGSRVWEIAGKALEEFGDPQATYTTHRQCSEEAMARLSEQQSKELMRKGIVRGMPKRME